MSSNKMETAIHPSIYPFSYTYPIHGCGGAGAYPRCHRATGRVLP